jgi:hypothetical protein
MKNSGILLNPATGDFEVKVVRDSKGKILQGLQVGEITKQNIALILYMQPGELKEYPTVGVGINNMLLDHDSLLYKHKIRQQLDVEGIRVNRLEINGRNIGIDADYK